MLEALQNDCKLEMPAKMEGKRMVALLAPKTAGSDKGGQPAKPKPPAAPKPAAPAPPTASGAPAPAAPKPPAPAPKPPPKA